MLAEPGWALSTTSALGNSLHRIHELPCQPAFQIFTDLFETSIFSLPPREIKSVSSYIMKFTRVLGPCFSFLQTLYIPGYLCPNLTFTIKYTNADGLKTVVSDPHQGYFHLLVSWVLQTLYISNWINHIPHPSQIVSFPNDSTVLIFTTIYLSILARDSGVSLPPSPHIHLLSLQIQSLLLSKCYLNPFSPPPFSLTLP